MCLASHLLVFGLAFPGLSMDTSSTFPHFSLVPMGWVCINIQIYTHTHSHTKAEIFTLLSFLVTHVAFPLRYTQAVASYWLESNLKSFSSIYVLHLLKQKPLELLVCAW